MLLSLGVIMKTNMNPSILYSIWLNNNTTIFAGAYSFTESGELFYTDSKTDMEALYELFKSSEFYFNSI
jgi:hypothetical protein